MYVNDPSEKAQLPIRTSPVEDEEPRPAADFFWDDTSLGARSLPYQMPINVYHEICRFDEHGEHTQMGKNCPHFEPSDEMGRNIVPGWTVQNGN